MGLVCRESSILVMQVRCFEEEKNHMGLYIYVLWEWTLSPLRFVVLICINIFTPSHIGKNPQDY
jgi:hypothetical protein